MLSLMRPVRRRVLGEADQDPVARLRLQPHADFLLATLAEAQPQDRGAGLRRRLQLQAREAVGIDAERRLARAHGDELVVVLAIRLPTTSDTAPATLNAPSVPGRAGLPAESIMRTAMTGCVRPSATSVEASRTISARTAPPA